jgi:hypothetical protein
MLATEGMITVLSSLLQLKCDAVFPRSADTDLINYIILANADFTEPSYE